MRLAVGEGLVMKQHRQTGRFAEVTLGHVNDRLPYQEIMVMWASIFSGETRAAPCSRWGGEASSGA